MERDDGPGEVQGTQRWNPGPDTQQQSAVGASSQHVVVQSYLAVLRAEGFAAAGDHARAETALDWRLLQRCWRTAGGSAFAHRCMLRGLRCKMQTGVAPSDRCLALQLIGRLVFGPTQDEVCAGSIEALFRLCSSATECMSAVAEMLVGATPPSFAAQIGRGAEEQGDPAGTAHCAVRLARVLGAALQRSMLSESSVQCIRTADLFGCGSGAALPLLRHLLSRPPAALRCAGLRLMADMCVASPACLVRLLPALGLAVYTEQSARVREVACGLLWDVVFAVPHLGYAITETTEGDGAASSPVSFLPELLLCGESSLQLVSLRGAGRLLLFGAVEAPEVLIARVAQVASRRQTDPRVASWATTVLRRCAARGKQEWLGNAIVHLCVEAHAAKLIGPGVPPARQPAATLLSALLDSDVREATEVTVQSNLQSFFGYLPPLPLVRCWLGLS
eukprot:Hpha_TRINITY_DN6322_c0_g1::TRINITY_DN6322_c0_g1_i1::g.145582::m.145582